MKTADDRKRPSAIFFGDLQIAVYRSNSEFGMRNSELRGDDRLSRNLTSASSKNPFLSTMFTEMISVEFPPRSLIPNYEFRIPNFGHRPTNPNLNHRPTAPHFFIARRQRAAGNPPPRPRARLGTSPLPTIQGSPRTPPPAYGGGTPEAGRRRPPIQPRTGRSDAP